MKEEGRGKKEEGSKEEGRRKKEEGRGKREEGRRKREEENGLITYYRLPITNYLLPNPHSPFRRKTRSCVGTGAIAGKIEK